MNLINDIYTIFYARRGKICFFSKHTNIINTIITCSINFYNIKN